MNLPFERMDVHELKRRMDEGWEPYVLDVRSAGEANVASLGFTDRLEPHITVARIIDELPRDRDIIVYCRSGARSASACMQLAPHGFERLWNLEGGILAWADAIDPSLQPY